MLEVASVAEQLSSILPVNTGVHWSLLRPASSPRLLLLSLHRDRPPALCSNILLNTAAFVGFVCESSLWSTF